MIVTVVPKHTWRKEPLAWRGTTMEGIWDLKWVYSSIFGGGFGEEDVVCGILKYTTATYSKLQLRSLCCIYLHRL